MTREGRVSLTLGLAAVAILIACVSSSLAGDPVLPPAPPHLNGQVLWHIVHDQCVPDEEQRGRTDPCAEISLQGGIDRGFALLKDRRGVAQYLLMPTVQITGIEDPRLLAPRQVNYFAQAWKARSFVEARLGRALPDEDLGVAVNSIYGRSQDLLHLHVDCLAPSTVAYLKIHGSIIGSHWSRIPLSLQGHRYFALRLIGEDLKADPFLLLAQGVPGARRQMGAWTLVLAGGRAVGEGPFFFLLASRADPLAGDFASGEELQDHECAVAKTAPLFSGS